MKNKRGQRFISVALTVVLMHGVAGSAEVARFEALPRLLGILGDAACAFPWRRARHGVRLCVW